MLDSPVIIMPDEELEKMLSKLPKAEENHERTVNICKQLVGCNNTNPKLLLLGMKALIKIIDKNHIFDDNKDEMTT